MTAATQLSVQRAKVQPACWGVEPDTFFGSADSADGQPLFGWEREALVVCTGCPVQAACLAAALEFLADEQHGVIGGMTAGQRRVLLWATRHRPSRWSVTDTPRDRQRRVQAAVRWHQAGHHARWIADRLDLGERRVQRWLAAHRAGLGVA